MIKIWRCEYTREWILGTVKHGGTALFGGWLPFVGWKWIGCNPFGYVDNDTWPPKYVTPKFGMMWFGRGSFYTPPWETEIRKV